MKKWEKNSLAWRTSEPIVPPLKGSSDIVANHPGILPGTNPADYMHDDDAHFDITLVGKGAFTPVCKGLLSRFSNRD